jgi:hypothetical protein
MYGARTQFAGSCLVNNILKEETLTPLFRKESVSRSFLKYG